MKEKDKIRYLEEQIHRLSEIGMALSSEKNTDRLFEMILDEASRITNADGRTLYTIDENGNLKFEILRRFLIICDLREDGEAESIREVI